MKKILAILAIGFTAFISVEAQTHEIAATATNQTTVQTIIAIRHGEKPPGGLGQLTCRGLNRSLALPEVLLKKFGAPQFIFAPNPSQKSDGNKYFYLRPLATIEPTAIRCGRPVNTQFGYKEFKDLEAELQKPEYQNATTFIAWEHHLLDEFGRNLVKDNGGDVNEVPEWPQDEYDMIFVFKITTENGQKKISFSVDHEGLNGLSDQCP